MCRVLLEHPGEFRGRFTHSHAARIQTPVRLRRVRFPKSGCSSVEPDGGDAGRDHIRADTARLDRLYNSVTERVRQVPDPEGRLKILLELYESFFAKGMKRETDRLGVAYTPH